MKHTYIIAEAGVNHNGSIDLAKQLIDVAVEAGVDAVKFQTFKAAHIASRRAPKADYQKRLTDQAETQYDMLKKLELSEEDHAYLIDYCQQKGIEFLSTPFDIESVDMLVNKFHLPKLKISSGEITNAPLLLHVAQKGTPVILSTGMSTLAEIRDALGVLAFGYLQEDFPTHVEEFQQAYLAEAGKAVLKEKVTLLHCTTEYPAPFSEINLRVIDTLSKEYNLPVGLSDHSEGITVPIAAVARGAKVIEKHFTLDRTLPGPDHQASLEPDELKRMVKSIREVEQALGLAEKIPTASENKNKPIARKSLVAKQQISKGEPFTSQNLTVKRPGDGISPLYYWDWLRKVAEKDYEKDEVIKS